MQSLAFENQGGKHVKTNKSKIYGYNSLIGGIVGIVCALVLFVFAIFMDYGIICVIMGVFSAVSGALLIVRSFSHEAALEENSEYIDERSIQLAYESKAKAFDITAAVWNDIGFLLILGYFIWEIDALAYFYLGVQTMALTAAVVQTAALNRLDKEGIFTRTKKRKLKIGIRRLRSVIIGFALFTYIFVQSIIESLFTYSPILISILCIACLAYAASGFTFEGKDKKQ